MEEELAKYLRGGPTMCLSEERQQQAEGHRRHGARLRTRELCSAGRASLKRRRCGNAGRRRRDRRHHDEYAGNTKPASAYQGASTRSISMPCCSSALGYILVLLQGQALFQVSASCSLFCSVKQQPQLDNEGYILVLLQ